MSSSPKQSIIRLEQSSLRRGDELLSLSDAQKRQVLAREYWRIHRVVWPPYTDAIGEHGIAKLAASMHVSPDSRQFALYTARAARAQLRLRVLDWDANPPTGDELTALGALAEINPARHGQPTLELVAARLVLSDMRIIPLEAQIPVDDTGLARAWNDVADTPRAALPVMSLATPEWLREPEPDAAPAPPQPKRTIH